MARFPKNMKLSEKEVSQAIDIETEFGVDLSDFPLLRKKIGQAMVDRIIDRNEKENVNLWGTKFKPYDEKYIKSDAFKDFGKSASKVDMTLTGKMLEAVDFKDGKHVIQLFVKKKETPKAYNHQVGDTVPPRSWFGMAKSDYEKIKKKFKSDLDKAKEDLFTARERRKTAADLETIAEAEQLTSREIFDELFDVSFGGVE